jgi:hypothetical protein
MILQKVTFLISLSLVLAQFNDDFDFMDNFQMPEVDQVENFQGQTGFSSSLLDGLPDSANIRQLLAQITAAIQRPRQGTARAASTSEAKTAQNRAAQTASGYSSPRVTPVRVPTRSDTVAATTPRVQTARAQNGYGSRPVPLPVTAAPYGPRQVPKPITAVPYGPRPAPAPVTAAPYGRQQPIQMRPRPRQQPQPVSRQRNIPSIGYPY